MVALRNGLETGQGTRKPWKTDNRKNSKPTEVLMVPDSVDSESKKSNSNKSNLST